MGYALKRNDIPIVPMILGLVLGPILEGRMRQAIGTASGDLMVFVERPVSAAILALILLVIAGSVRGAFRRGCAEAEQAPQA